ncbi:nickel pincer cofactor biosynthesis protein LarB [uncultured Gimesia sp.]|uniref:nickel pincer cofactor biosynthesis protein LarB n=1 Tax=uncultured Gimesia sp. TaxID=1678688 RepID=UPI0030DC8E28|tara:strand:- start:149604 stop:150386 length:783 start_codon:yes stop_codon:yes gene_type:complete
MSDDQLSELFEQVREGALSVEQAMTQFQVQEHHKSAILPSANIDLDRSSRCGYPEVIYCEGKTPTTIVEIFTLLLESKQRCLGTRISEEQAETVLKQFPQAIYNQTARTIRIPKQDAASDEELIAGEIAVLTAGTSDQPVAEEAIETLIWMGYQPDFILDVGVAGPHRLQEQLPRIQNVSAIVVAAGMEGALPSVVGGWVSCPVIAVPTSVGYGASLGGIAALLGMLNSCAANVTVVNINAGFKAGFIAGLIADQKRSTS